MDRDQEWEEEGSAAFDAALRRTTLPGPDLALKARCLPAELRSSESAVRALRILVAEDEPAIRRLIEHHLSRAGYVVETACDGREALARVAGRLPDLIVLDVMMPGLNGYQVLDALKGDPRTAEIPVVMLTAKGDDGHVRRGWRRGVDCYMTKPFNPRELEVVVERIAAVLDTPENPPPLRRWLK